MFKRLRADFNYFLVRGQLGKACDVLPNCLNILFVYECLNCWSTKF